MILIDTILSGGWLFGGCSTHAAMSAIVKKAKSTGVAHWASFSMIGPSGWLMAHPAHSRATDGPLVPSSTRALLWPSLCLVMNPRLIVLLIILHSSFPESFSNLRT